MGSPDRQGAAGGIAERQRVGGHRLDLLGEDWRRERVLLDRPGAAGPGHFARIRRLVVVGRRRIGDQDRRTAGRGQLGNRRSAGAGNHQMGIGKLGRHILDIGHEIGGNAERGIAIADLRDVVGPALLDDLQPMAKRRLEKRQPLGDHAAEHRRALTSAGDENLERREFVERREWKLAELGDFDADGIADEHGLCAIFGLQAVHLVIGSRERRRFPGQQAVDPPEHRVLFVKDRRDPHRAGTEQRREGRIAAEADDRVRAVLGVEPLGLGCGRAQPSAAPSASRSGRRQAGRPAGCARERPGTGPESGRRGRR